LFIVEYESNILFQAEMKSEVTILFGFTM